MMLLRNKGLYWVALLLIGVLAVLLAFGLPSARAAEKIEKLTYGSGGKNRTYYLFVPEAASAGNAPVIVLEKPIHINLCLNQIL